MFTESSDQQLLAKGAKVKGDNHTYTIVKVLGRGAYGVTYLATTRARLSGDLGTFDMEVQVTLKEFYVPGKMTRSGDTVNRNLDDREMDSFARCFYMEADKISSLDHPNIVKVLEVFVANNTCYYAMEYLSGGSLTRLIEREDGLSEADALTYIRQIGSALAYMHQHKMLHLDVKPSNIMLNSEGTPKLIDYGLSQQYGNDGKPESDDGLGSGTPGFAPLEQSEMSDNSYFSPTVDVYALGATYYKMLTGYTPPSAVNILNNGISTQPLVHAKVSQQSILAIQAAMQPVVEKRLQTVDAFLAMLPDITPDGTSQQQKSSKTLWRRILLLIALIATIILIIVNYLV